MQKRLKKYQIFWNIAASLARFYPGYFFKRMPDEIIIEPTNNCNLRCPICPTHFAMKRKRGFIDFPLFKSIIDEFKNIKKKPRISFDFAGEPLLNREIDKLVAYANKRGHGTYISTNATMLTKDLSRKLIQAGLSSVRLCLEGINKKSHEAYRRGSNFETVKKNIEDFLRIKKELNSKMPLVIIQTLLTSYSENEIDKIIKWATEAGADYVNFKSLSLGSYTTEEIRRKYSYLLPQNEEYRRKILNIRKTLCLIPKKQALVYWNGDLGLCCIDFDNVADFPNMKKKGFIKTFTSPEVRKKRKLGFRKQLGLCKNCDFVNAGYMGFSIALKQKVKHNQ